MRRYILGFFTAAAAAAALWLLHRTFPCPLTALLAPANGSPWEMGKLLFWPYLPAALVIWRLGPEGGCRGGHCLLLAVMPPMLGVLAVVSWKPDLGHIAWPDALSEPRMRQSPFSAVPNR